MSRVWLCAEGCLGLCQCFTGPDALVPRVTKLGVTSTSAVSEPRTTATTASDFPRFSDGATFGAHGTDGRRRVCRCVYVGIGQNTKMKHEKKSLLGLREELSTER